MKPLVAIIVPVYNAEKYIVRCARSLFSQTYEAIEFVFVNDASTDKSIELLKQTLSQNPERKPQVTILEQTSNIGAAAARHSGIMSSSSEYILMIDADDYIDSEMVEKHIQVAVSEQVDIVISDIYLEYGKKTIVFQNQVSDNKISNIQGLLTETTISPSLCSKLIKRSLYLHEDCTHNKELIYHEDKYLLLKILYTSNKIAQIPKAFYHYTQYNTASITREKTEKHFNSVVLFWKLTEQFFEDKKCINDFIETINYAKVKQKAVLLVTTHDIHLRKKFADMYSDIEKDYIKKLRLGEKIMLKLIRLKLFYLSQILHNLLLLKNKKALYYNKKTYYLQKQQQLSSMKKITAISLFLTIILFSSNATDYRTIPLAQKIELKAGFTFSLNEKVKIAYDSKSKAQKKNAEFLKQFIQEKTDLTLKITKSTNKANRIVLAIDAKIEHPEGYKITIDSKKIVIAGKTEAGVFYGIQTLCKSIPNDKNAQLPPVEITDEPRFNYRGMHLDVSRHFFSVDFVKKYIDMLALHHVNTFHWHLSDDQGWRIEIKKHPKLTKIGSIRKQTLVGRYNSGIYDSIPYSGYYTQNQIKEVIKYASERYINIIPEIDMPGHMLAALTAYPNLGCTGGPYKVAEKWGIFDDVLCAGNEMSYKFAQDVLSEIIHLFPSKYIHIGGDECRKSNWKVCPKCQYRIKTEGLSADSLHSAENKLQSYFISRIEKFVNSKNRQIIGWDEILEGGLAPNAVVMSWRGVRGGIEAAKSNHKVIMTPNSHLYFDFYQSENRENEPLAIGGFLPVDKVYNFEPIPAELNETEAKYVIGAQANLWTEYIATEQHAEYMLLPRLAALSEVQWTMPEQKNYSDFLLRLPQLTETYKKRGYNFAKHALNDSIK